MTKYLIPVAIVLAGLLIAGAVFYTKDGQQKDNLSQKEKEQAPSKVEITITEKDNIRGNPEAEVTIVEFSDFQCPFCQGFHPTVKQILENYPDQVRWVYKHFPLDLIHPNARPAAEASECAAEQGKFWEFSDGLLANQSRLEKALYEELAQNLGLSMENFKNCFSARKYKDKVETDYQEGIRVGVRGTPGSFINGELISGALPYATLKTIIDLALSK
ncbi:MAG: DsbA family protein [Candidatus Wildermuthbacteria bacterium]|nr:DsbA family protein [Candidatus Wildermuthbacteria bacterium]